MKHDEEETIKTHYAVVKANDEDECSTGDRQSPVDIRSIDLITSEERPVTNLNVALARVVPTSGLKMAAIDDRVFLAGLKKMNIVFKIKGPLLPSTSSLNTELDRFGFDTKFSEFRLEYVDFWWPSLHLVDGVGADLEIHFRFRNLDADVLRKKYLVVGAMGKWRGGGLAPESSGEREWPFEEAVASTLRSISDIASASETLTSASRRDGVSKGIWENFPAPSGVNLVDLLPFGDATRFYAYEGSLPNPPCTEGVFWLVHRDFFYFGELLEKAMKDFRFPIEGSGGIRRRLQDLNGRHIVSVDFLI